MDFAAFVDEADAEPTPARSGVYLAVAAVIDRRQLPQVEAVARSLLREEDTDLKGHTRLHLSRIKDRKRKNDLIIALASLRGTRFVTAWTSGYTDPKHRERARGQVLWELLPHLAKDVASVLIEQREDAKLRAADARVVGRLRSTDLLPREVRVEQTPASQAPGLWLADAAAAAWRRHYAENKRNWSCWYEPHTTVIEVPFHP